MLARQFTLKKDKEFKRVEQEGQLLQSDSFGLAFYNRQDQENSHFGFIVSLKMSKEAVQRNRIKRALSEAVRYLLKDMQPGYDIVFLTKPESLRRSTDQLMKETKAALERAGLVRC